MKLIRTLDTDLKGVAAALNITVPYARKLWLKGAFPGYRLGHRTLRFCLVDVLTAIRKGKTHERIAT